MNEKKKLSGKELLEKMQEFLENNENLIKKLKVTRIVGEYANINIIRCNALEEFLNLLDEKMIVAALQNQHDVISVFLNYTLKQGNLSQIKQRNIEGTEIDLMHGLENYELKTRKNLEVNDIPDFISDYYQDMIKNQGVKDKWWLVFFQQRTDTKDKIQEICLYYLVLIEIPTKNLDYPNKNTITKEVIKLVQKAEKKVLEEDNINDDEGILVPVDNIIVVDRLRKKVEKKDQIIQQKDQIIHQKDLENKKIIQQKDLENKKIIQQKDQIIHQKDLENKKLKEEIKRLKGKK